MSSYEYKALSLSKKIAHSTTVMPFFKASSFTSRSLVSSCIFARALRCSSRWIPNSCRDSVKCNNDGWHEASSNSSVEAPELVPDRLPPSAVRTLAGIRERTGVAALDEPPGRVRGTFLGDCWEVDSERPFDCALNDFFKGELEMGYENVGLVRIQKETITYTAHFDGHFPRPVDNFLSIREPRGYRNSGCFDVDIALGPSVSFAIRRPRDMNRWNTLLCGVGRDLLPPYRYRPRWPVFKNPFFHELGLPQPRGPARPLPPSVRSPFGGQRL